VINRIELRNRIALDRVKPTQNVAEEAAVSGVA
jgi:hypothetical protein